MTRPGVLCVFGTRPEAIKIAPVIWACRAKRDLLRTIVCCTGQHRELVDQIANYLELKPDADLGAMVAGQSLAALLSRCLMSLDEIIERFEPACIVAQGDTTSTLAASLCAFFHRLPMVHVEAGLRTRNLFFPWPEELFRYVVGLTAWMHCAPTRQAAGNLISEGKPQEIVYVTGNTVVDALQWTLQREKGHEEAWRLKYDFSGDAGLVVVTAHRRENQGQRLRRICRAIAKLAHHCSGARIVMPVHPNPDVQGPVRKALSGLSNIFLVDPLPYPEFVWLLNRASLVITDSGGIQEEACVLGKRVLVLRSVTERPEAVDAGWAELVDADESLIFNRGTALMEAMDERSSPGTNNPFGDGHAGERIAQLLLEHLVGVK